MNGTLPRWIPSLLHGIFVCQLTTTFALGQLVPQSKPLGVPGEPATVVRSLYQVVVARHPIGLPWGADREAIAPYLSRALIRRLDTTLACQDDYLRQHQNPNEKPQFDWFELGLFSGGNERGSPGGFHVESVVPEKDGSFRVHVRLKYSEPDSMPYWYVDVIVTRKNKDFLVDDVVFPKDDWDDESRLSQTLTLGCDGSRWVGYVEERNESK